MTDQAPKRRRFRFTLRTLFVVMTLLCIFLANGATWVYHRRAFIAHQLALREAAAGSPVKQSFAGVEAPVTPPREIPPPGSLRLFGEKGHQSISILVDVRDRRELTAVHQAQMERAKRLFPEAEHINFYWYAGETSATRRRQPEPVFCEIDFLRKEFNGGFPFDDDQELPDWRPGLSYDEFRALVESYFPRAAQKRHAAERDKQASQSSGKSNEKASGDQR